MPITAIEALRVLLAALLFLAPGILLVGPLFGRQAPSGVARLMLGLGLGLGASGLFLWINTHLGAPLGLWIGVWIFLVAAFAVARWLARRRSPAEVGERRVAPFTGTPGRLLAGLCLVSALVAPILGSYVGASADSWDYLNRATAILRADRLDAPNPYSPGFHNPYDPTFYGFIAVISRVSGVPPPKVWRVFPAVATPMEIGVMAVTAGLLIGSAGAGTAAAFVYALVYGPFFLFRNSGHHQMLGDVLYLLCLAGLFLYWRHGRKRHLVLGALAAVAGVAFHHFILVECAFGLGVAGAGVLLVSRGFPDRGRRAVVYVATVGLTLLPVAILVQLEYVSQIDLKAMNRQFAEDVSPLLHFGPLYMPDPFPWFFRSFWRPIPALLLLVHFMRRLRDPRVVAIGALLVAPVFIVLNPLVFPLLAGLAGLQVSTRLLNLTAYPSIILFGWVLFEWMTGRRVPAEPGTDVEGERDAAGAIAGSHPAISRPLAFAGAALSLAPILVQALIRIQGDYAPDAIERERANSPAAWSGALAELSRRAKPGDMVLSDFVTAYAIPSFAPVWIVANFREDFAYQTDDFGRRLLAIDTVLGPLSPPDSTMAALDLYDVDWIVVNRRLANPLAVDKLNRLADLGSGIRREFERDGLHVYSVDRDRPDVAPVSRDEALDGLLISPAMFQAFKEPGTGLVFDGATGIGAVMGPDSAAAGDTVYITLYYQWRDEPPLRPLHPKLIRDEAYGPGQWLARQFRTSILGRYDSMLFVRDLEYRAFRTRSFLPGTVFADMFEIPVARGVAKGRFSLYVREGDYPTDSEKGIRLGEVEIVRPVP